jgi:diadenosine tetraphosphate (Ap4A) HIT family hydrolase
MSLPELSPCPFCSGAGIVLRNDLAYVCIVRAVAGQTVGHVHLHLIPRYAGDVANRRGGVRGVVPARQDY